MYMGGPLLGEKIHIYENQIFSLKCHAFIYMYVSKMAVNLCLKSLPRITYTIKEDLYGFI